MRPSEARPSAIEVALQTPAPAPAVPNAFRRLVDSAVSAVLPARCLGCGGIVEAPGTLCPSCWREVTFLGAPHCAACGLPFPYSVGAGALCGPCSRAAPPFHRARAAVAYDDGSRSLILAFKHGDRTEAAPVLGRWMMRAGRELLDEADVLVPVPLHWTRLFARRYNQAALLARAVSRLSGVPAILNALVRRRRTPSLGTLGPAARRARLKGVIAVKSRRAQLLEAKRIVLIDDVLTSGATAEACANALSAAGAARIDVLTLARVVRPPTF